VIEARQNGKLSFDEFRHILASELKLDAERIVPEASFFTDLRVDSVRVVDTMLRLEDKGINIPLELAWLVETVGDAYQVMIYRKKH
jgi:acyl carrier protein